MHIKCGTYQKRIFQVRFLSWLCFVLSLLLIHISRQDDQQSAFGKADHSLIFDDLVADAQGGVVGQKWPVRGYLTPLRVTPRAKDP